MKFLYIRVKGTMNDLIYGINALGHSVGIVDDCIFEKHSNKPQTIETLHKHLDNNEYDYAISYMFSIDVSIILKEHGIKYISWIYDSPDSLLYTKEAEDDNNYIFVFDRMFYNHLKITRNIAHLYYLPLGSCTPRIDRINITQKDIEKYSGDVSFVGNLYENNQYNILSEYLSKKDIEYIQNYVNNNCCMWHRPRRWPSITNNCLNILTDAGYFKTAPSFEMDKSTYLGIAIMARKLAQIERVIILDELGRTENVKLYTNSDASLLHNVNVCSAVDYESDMSIVFNQSKINLNITIPSIESGIPQRVWDIIGSGGFCMTNYQPEIEEYFEIGKDIETFKDFEELRIKTRFYLEHDDLRLKILINGYEKIVKNHTYMHRINRMIECCENDT